MLQVVFLETHKQLFFYIWTRIRFKYKYDRIFVSDPYTTFYIWLSCWRSEKNENMPLNFSFNTLFSHSIYTYIYIYICFYLHGKNNHRWYVQDSKENSIFFMFSSTPMNQSTPLFFNLIWVFKKPINFSFF